MGSPWWWGNLTGEAVNPARACGGHLEVADDGGTGVGMMCFLAG